MADRPILILPTPATIERDKGQGGGREFKKPSRADQHRRHGRKLQDVARSFDGIRASAAGNDPEQVLVFEVAFEHVDGLMKLAKASQQIDGLEWLAELDLGDQVRDDFGRTLGEPTPIRLYAFLTNQAAMNRLLGLWDQWRAGNKAPRYYGPFWQLFQHLTDIRRWDASDRVEDTGLAEWWEERLLVGNGPIRFEAELWFRERPLDRQHAAQSLADALEASQGIIVDACEISEIRYHGVLLECPRETIQDAFDRMRQSDYVRFLQCDDVRFFRGTGQSMLSIVDVEDAQSTEDVAHRPLPQRKPLVAVLDGLPLDGHNDLRDRLVLDDPEGVAASYPAAHRQHGTAMASLIIHGDLAANEPPTDRRVYIRPVMLPTNVSGEFQESFPEDRLFVDVIHTAVRRIVARDGPEAPIAPSVRIINLSIGNPYLPFVREMSPLARLIDWLSHLYRLLFIISAGNFRDEIAYEMSSDELSALDADSAIQATLGVSNRDRPLRRLIAPAESLNALTVGAWHADAAGPAPAPTLTSVDLLQDKNLPSLVNPIASGLHRSIKPELMMPGGRQYYCPRIGHDPATFTPVSSIRLPGQSVAAPGSVGADLSRRINKRGTSNAAALTSRLASAVYDNLESSLIADNVVPDPTRLTLMTKALLVHGAMWGDNAREVDPICDQEPEWQSQRRTKAAWLGYGPVDPSRCLTATDQRVLFVGSGELEDGEAQEYLIPIPTRLSGQALRRRVVVTLAWLTPVNNQHRRYRRASLWTTRQSDVDRLTQSSSEVHESLSKAGTVQHLVYETDEVVAIQDDQNLKIKVNCKADAGELAEAVDYGIAVTVEIADPTDIDIYTEISERIAQRVQTTPIPAT